MPSYYSCDGVVSVVGNGKNQGLKCSTGWSSVSSVPQTIEFSGDLITLEQGRELLSVLALLVVTIAVFRALGRIG